MPQVYNWQGKQYSPNTVHDAPVEFLIFLAERGTLDPAAALAAEQAGQKRVTLIRALEAMLAEDASSEEEE